MGEWGGPFGLWTSIEVVASTGSTNADLLARGGPEGQVLVAEEQTAGRGRAGRTWVSQPGASLTFSVLLRPASVPPGFKEAVEEACNAELRSDRKIVVRSLPRAEAFELPDIIRTATNLVPDDVEEVRIVDIVGLDQQADGGTHVASTAAVGRMSVVKVENKGKGFRRLRIAIGD